MPRAFPGPQSCGYGCEIRLGQEVLLSFSPPSCAPTLSSGEFDLPLLVASGQSPVLGAAPFPVTLLLPSLTQERALQLCCKMQTPCLESPAHKSSLPSPCSSLSLSCQAFSNLSPASPLERTERNAVGEPSGSREEKGAGKGRGEFCPPEVVNKEDRGIRGSPHIWGTGTFCLGHTQEAHVPGLALLASSLLHSLICSQPAFSFFPSSTPSPKESAFLFQVQSPFNLF